MNRIAGACGFRRFQTTDKTNKLLIDMDLQKFEEYEKLLMSDRSVRRFNNSREIDREFLVRLVGLTRLCASGRNAQPLKYRIVSSREECELIFLHLAWAGYYKEWPGPDPYERPVAYLVQCLDTEIEKEPLCDDGIQLQAITLGAKTAGIAGCIIKAFNAKEVSRVLNIDNRYKPRYVLALGYPAEKVHIVEMDKEGDFKYYRDINDDQCVPKRPVAQLIID